MKVRTEGQSMSRKPVAEPRCSNGIHCVAYPHLGEPSKLSRGNPGPRCFACEERRVAAELEVAAAKEKVVEARKAGQTRSAKSNALKEQTEPLGHAYEIRERRRMTVLTCEEGLRSALASGDERLARRWSRLLREAQERLAWADEDLEVAESRARSDYAR
jgi:hypothetical protein